MGSYKVIFSDEMYHSRTKGSKNGVRLYQNEDGTWTELGKERRRKQVDYLFTKGKKDKPSPAESVISNTNKITGELQKGTRFDPKKNRARKAAYNRAKSMSDDELRRYINRRDLEQKYVNIETRNIRSGMDVLNTTLDVVGSLLVIGGAVVSIGSTIYTMKKLSEG